MFSLFNFSSVFKGGSADPICPYVRTSMLAPKCTVPARVVGQTDGWTYGWIAS